MNANSNEEDITTVTEYGTLEEMAKEEASTNCVSGSKKNQRYSSSFFDNTTDQALTVEKEFHDVVGNNSKVKKYSSVHEGEDITLCWIEMTTIKEDKTVRPPKRLVVREYTISFENSATIPERYLECKRYEGEMRANDPDVGKTALFEVIDEDTMVSRIVNFTSVSHVDNITTWEYKKVKCGVGPVVSKNIMELNDGSKNPKKRVEIKVSPKMHQLTATTTDEAELCTESSENKSSSESTEHTIGLFCENGVCEATMTSPSISTEIGITEETKSGSDEDHSLSTVTKSLTSPDEEVSRWSTIGPKVSTTIQEYQEKTDCEENSSDPACFTQKYGTRSLEELFPTTEAVETSSISEEITTKESEEEGRLKETTPFTSREEKTVTSHSITEETTPFTIVTDVSTDSSETYDRSTDQGFVDGSTTSSETEIDHSATEEYSKPEEGSGDSSILISEEIDKIDRVPSTNMMTSGEVKPDATSAIPIEFTEFTEEPEGFVRTSDDKELVEPSISIESGRESSLTSEESRESTSTIERTTVGLRTLRVSRDEEFTSTTTRTTSPTDDRSTVSSEIDYSCENSEECVYMNSVEECEDSENCGETTPRCDSEECSEVEVTDGQFDKSPPITRAPSSEEPTQYTTVASVATTILTSREGENNSTAVNNVPFTMDTRRSTTTSTPQQNLSLIIKILLQFINDKEKRNLIEVEKHMSLDGSPEHRDKLNLFEQMKVLNNSVNMETINALLNCTKLGSWIRDSNFVSKESDNAVDDNDEDLEFTDSYVEDSSSEQYASGYADAKNDQSEHTEISSRRRRRRSLDNETERNRFVRQIHDSTDSVVDFFNGTTSQQADLTTDNSTFSATTNHPEGETTESERNVTEEGEESMVPSTTMSIIDLSNASESHDANLTQESVQLNATTNKPEEETSNAVYGENEKNVTSERNESATGKPLLRMFLTRAPLTRESISNKTKMEVVREIQQDVAVGLQHVMSQLTQSNLTSMNNIKKADKSNLLRILADPKDPRIRRRRRAAMEEVGHWSNERIKEAPMGGNLRSLTEFTLYKVLP